MDIHVWNLKLHHYQEESAVIWQLNSWDLLWVKSEGRVHGFYDNFELNWCWDGSVLASILWSKLQIISNCIVMPHSAQRWTRFTRFLAELHATFMTFESTASTAASLCTGWCLMHSGITTLLFFFNLGTLLPSYRRGIPRLFPLSINHSSLGETLSPWIIKYTVLESKTKYCHEWQ